MLASLLVRPRLFDQENQQRCEYYRVRHQLLTDDFDEEMTQWLEEVAGVDVAQQWGIPDTALNPIAAATKQLVTPGLYGRRPTVNVDAPAGEEHAGLGGYMDRARMWTRSQWVQYLAVGAGICFRRVGVRTDLARNEAHLTDSIVLPHNIIPFTHPDDPTRLVAIWHLRVRTVVNSTTGKKDCFYAYDQWEIDNLGRGTLRVVQCGFDGQPGKDRSRDVLTGPDGIRGEMTAERFPALDPEGRAFLPWVIYRAVDTGEFWPVWRRSMHRGTLRACAHWTYVSRCALFSTGEHVIVSGIDPASMTGVAVQRGDGDQQQSLNAQATVRIHPGTITFAPLEAREGASLQHIKIGPGVNLPNLAEFANMYNMMLHLADGLHPTDATRQSANPTSGAALEISARSRREFSAQITPLFREADLELIQKTAWLLQMVGINVPADGYSVEYHTIPLSPSEQEDLRADLEWEEEHGQISPIDIHLKLHPGKTPEQAEQAIIKARVDTARIAFKVKEALAAEGLDTGEDKSNNPFAQVGLPALIAAGVISAADARQMLGISGPPPEKQEPPPELNPGGGPPGEDEEDEDGEDLDPDAEDEDEEQDPPK